MGVIVCIWILVSVLMGNFSTSLALNKKSPIFNSHWTFRQWDKQLYTNSLLTLNCDILPFETRCIPFPTDINHVPCFVVLVNLFYFSWQGVVTQAHRLVLTWIWCAIQRGWLWRSLGKTETPLLTCITFYISPSKAGYPAHNPLKNLSACWEDSNSLVHVTWQNWTHTH